MTLLNRLRVLAKTIRRRNDTLEHLTRVTRLEVIDEEGRVYSRKPCAVAISYQDDRRTLKVFVRQIDVPFGS